MARYLLIVDFQAGVVDTPMEEWLPEEVDAHPDYYRVLDRELVASGELVGSEVLAGPDLARLVTSDGTTTTVLDGPFAEFKEWVAGYQIVEVPTEARALEIAARVSAVPGPGGRATQQPIQVRRIHESSPQTADEMVAYLETASGTERVR